MIKKYLPHMWLVVILAGCSSNTYMTGSYKNEEMVGKGNYQSVFIAAITHNNSAKTIVENELAFQLEERGFKAIRSYEIFPPTFTNQGQPAKEQLLEKIRETGADAIFTITLVDKTSETRYVPGTTNYGTGYAPLGYGGYYGNFYGYYSTMYPTVYDPGYYTTDKVYYLESNLYDTDTEQLLWSGQSETYNPSDIEGFTQGYTDAILKKLTKDGLLKK